MMDRRQLAAIENHLDNDARPIDVAMYDFNFRGGSAQAVLGELDHYRNDDGGFGKAIEPDLRLPQSTALATCLAFRVMDEVGVGRDNEVLQRGLHYLLTSYDEQLRGWAIVRSEVDDYPHAPWWEYEAAINHFGWGNPSAELLGFLIKYGDPDATQLVTALRQRALDRIQSVDAAQFHEVLNFKALYDLADEDLRQQLHDPLGRLITAAATVNPDDWTAYVAPPLSFISSPNDPFAQLFDEVILRKNVDFIIASMVDGDHWEPNWDWSGTYPEDWQIAKQEWIGQLTVRNLRTLRDFGAITP